MASHSNSAVSRFAPERSRGRLAIAVLAGASLAFAACRPKPRQTDPNAHVSIQFDPGPPVVGQSTLNVTLTDAAGQPLRIGNLAVEGDMNHAGMKPVFARLQEMAPGRYTGRLHFTMGGDWFLLFTGDRADGGHFEKRVAVPGVRTQ
ncbi:MAG TPA: FixH family protein [Opitutus sp.]|nr:FixH family protein [Opitutus sp.]